ncbi:hypothetical protein Rhopal_003645-T1 [Rhodotorula paludigena]|uniref:Uncharacterized protein n=1 Tax=Rhodotorula paludigena TaxID=86838 RepID=A0AAV5GK86_9BASI|nr:hypothetical protein Rhopal_003645-T1 [Rhodotorula paludigena]
MSYHLPPNPFSVPPMPFHPPPTPFYAQPMLPRHTDAPLPGAMINVWAPGATLHLGGTASAGSSVLDDRSRGAHFEAQYARSDGTMLGPDAPIDLLAPPLRERLSNRGCIVAFGLPRECVRARDAFVWLMSAARCRGYQGGGPALLAGATADEAGGLVKNGYVVAAFEHQSDAKAILLAFRSPSQTDDTDLPDLPDPASSVYPIVTSARYQPEWRVGMLVPWHTALSVYRPGNAETDPLSTTPPSSGTHEKAQIHHLSQEPRRAAGPIALDTPPPSPEQLR